MARNCYDDVFEMQSESVPRSVKSTSYLWTVARRKQPQSKHPIP